MLWYSATQVGIVDIDLDHHNIDIMLQLYFTGNCPESALLAIIDGLTNHLPHEEKIIADLGRSFPEDHKREHERLTVELEKMKIQWEAGEIEGQRLAESIREILLFHVSNFDVFLGKTPA